VCRRGEVCGLWPHLTGCIDQSVIQCRQQEVRGLLVEHDSWSKTLRLLRKLCGLAEAQCAVVDTLFTEVLLLCIWFSYMMWQTRITTNDCAYCVGEPLI